MHRSAPSSVCRELAANFQQAELQLMQANDHSRQDKRYGYHGDDYHSDTDSSNGQEHCHLDHHFVITVSTLTSTEAPMRESSAVFRIYQRTCNSLSI